MLSCHYGEIILHSTDSGSLVSINQLLGIKLYFAKVEKNETIWKTLYYRPLRSFFCKNECPWYEKNHLTASKIEGQDQEKGSF